MTRTCGIVAVLAALLAWPGPSAAQPVDVVIVVDNSGSMRVNDPQGLARHAVRELAARLRADDHVAMLAFDERVRLEVSLTPAYAADLEPAIGRLDYRGQWTDIPAAVERALYHLERNGRPDAAHVILLLTDGIVETGNAARDRDREAWLLGELVDDAAARDVRIFGVAFSDDADFRLIQALAQRTGADYRRVLEPGGLGAAFAALHAQFVPPPPAEPAPVTDAPVAPPPAAAPVVEPAAPRAGWSPWPLVALAFVLLAAAGAFVWTRSRAGIRGPEPPPGAVLIDRGNVSGKSRIALPLARATIGRKASTESADATSVVIPRETISRRHATIAWKDGEYWLEDHDSANGTVVDDVPVKGAVRLVDGSKIRFDKYEFEFRLVYQQDHTLIRPEGQDDGDNTVVRPTTIFRQGVSDPE